jgi:acetyltransferase-like isoleucine patch superfamily enzyme
MRLFVESVLARIVMKLRLPIWIRNPIKSFIRDRLRWLLLRNYLVSGADKSRLKISEKAEVANTFFNVSSGSITVEDHVLFGYNVCVLTGTHDYNQFEESRMWSIPSQGRDVVIKKGAWVCTNSTIIGPCTIGEHAVVAAGSLVNRDVPPYTIVAGVPAKVIKTITPPVLAAANRGSFFNEPIPETIR